VSTCIRRRIRRRRSLRRLRRSRTQSWPEKRSLFRCCEFPVSSGLRTAPTRLRAVMTACRQREAQVSGALSQMLQQGLARADNPSKVRAHFPYIQSVLSCDVARSDGAEPGPRVQVPPSPVACGGVGTRRRPVLDTPTKNRRSRFLTVGFAFALAAATSALPLGRARRPQPGRGTSRRPRSSPGPTVRRHPG